MRRLIIVTAHQSQLPGGRGGPGRALHIFRSVHDTPAGYTLPAVDRSQLL